MPFFRSNLDVSRAAPRLAQPDDITTISRLFRDGAYRYMGFQSGDLPALLATAPAVTLVANAAIWGVVIAGWPTHASAWLRGFALTSGILPQDGVSALLPSLHALAHSRGVRRLYYAGDSAADTWMQPALRAIGYVRDTEVIVYEKRGLYVPSRGNPVVRIRRAVVVDLPQILEVDAACFTPQWMKDETIISPALVEMPYFVVAELGGAIVGYAFATKHFGGRLVHLVRIAVHPQYQGQRVGIRLLADVVDFARISGADTLALNTQVDNLNAQQLYEWFGFRRTGEWQTVLRKDI